MIGQRRDIPGEFRAVFGVIEVAPALVFDLQRSAGRVDQVLGVGRRTGVEDGVFLGRNRGTSGAAMSLAGRGGAKASGCIWVSFGFGVVSYVAKP